MSLPAPISDEGRPATIGARTPAALTWQEEMLAIKTAETLTLRRLLGQLEQAALQFLGQPFSPHCRAALRELIANNRRELQALDLAVAPPLLPAVIPPTGSPTS